MDPGAMDELAALREELRVAMGELEQAVEGLRTDGAAFLAQVETERAELRAAREEAMAEYAEEAREGGAGRARAELQRRLDAEETTWRAVMSGADEHWSAVQVRAEVVGDARAEIDVIERTDPEAARRYREAAVLRSGDRVGEWRA